MPFIYISCVVSFKVRATSLVTISGKSTRLVSQLRTCER